VAQAGVHVAEDADSEGAEGVCDLGVGGEAHGRVVVDDIADEGDEQHDGHLLDFALVDDNEAEGEGRDEDDAEPVRHAGRAGGSGDGVRVDGAVDGGPDCDAEAQEEGVDDCIDHPDGAGDDAPGLELEGAAEDGVAGEDEGDGGLG